MAHLGTITAIFTPQDNRPSPVLPVTDYNIIRGRFLGAVELIDARIVAPVLHSPLTTYVVRQIRILYRQLWPSHGQRFPQ